MLVNQAKLVAIGILRIVNRKIRPHLLQFLRNASNFSFVYSKQKRRTRKSQENEEKDRERRRRYPSIRLLALSLAVINQKISGKVKALVISPVTVSKIFTSIREYLVLFPLTDSRVFREGRWQVSGDCVSPPPLNSFATMVNNDAPSLRRDSLRFSGVER